MVVDSTHRLRELVQQMPGLKQKDENVQLFVRYTRTVEQLRHFVQHFRTEIDSHVGSLMPLWGTLSWSHFDEESHRPESHTIVPGTYYRGVRILGCTFDTQSLRFIERIVLHAGDARVDLADVYDRVERFSSWFEQWVLDTITGDEYHGADVHLRFELGVADPQ